MNNILVGFLITAMTQAAQVQDQSTAVAFFADDATSITQYLDQINNDMTPIIFIDRLFLDDGYYIYQDTKPLKYALEQSKHYSRIILATDEPCHKGRQVGQSCDTIMQVLNQIKADFHGVEWMHIEAAKELYYQYSENNGQLKLWYDADHIGFNCYTPFNACSSGDVPVLSHETYINIIHDQIQAHNSNAKIFLVGASFVNENYMTDHHEIMTQLNDYGAAAIRHDDKISGFGLFTAGDLLIPGDMSYGALNFPMMLESAKHNLRIVRENREMNKSS